MIIQDNKVVILVAICVLYCLSFGFAFAQNDVTDIEKLDSQKIDRLDALLVVTIPATLTGLSLAGASFLVGTMRNNLTELDSRNIASAIKYFIKAFLMFILCIIFIFILDFIEILRGEGVTILIIDLVLTYTTFGMGIAYLVGAAKRLYLLFGK